MPCDVRVEKHENNPTGKKICAGSCPNDGTTGTRHYAREDQSMMRVVRFLSGASGGRAGNDSDHGQSMESEAESPFVVYKAVRSDDSGGRRRYRLGGCGDSMRKSQPQTDFVSETSPRLKFFLRTVRHR